MRRKSLFIGIILLIIGLSLGYAVLSSNLNINGTSQIKNATWNIYWDNVQLDQTYRMDLVIDENIIVELKSIKFISDEHRKQLQNYLNITHIPYGMLINFSPDRIYSEWYERDTDGSIERIKLF